MGRDMICITCPIGCRLKVEEGAGGSIEVTGNRCARGRSYAEAEMRAPKRVLTLAIRIDRGSSATPADAAMLPCKTNAPFPKERIPELISILRAMRIKPPLAPGDAILKDALGTGIDVVATRGAG